MKKSCNYIIEAIDNVVFPLEKVLFENSEFKELVNNEKIFFKFNISLVKFVLALSKKVHLDPAEQFEYILDILNSSFVPHDKIREFFSYYFELYYKWTKVCIKSKDNEITGSVKDFEAIIENEFKGEFNYRLENDVMIFEPKIELKVGETKKISASEFMESGYIDDMMITHIMDLIKDFKESSSFAMNIDEEYVENFLEVLEGFISLFSYTPEFRILNEILIQLMNRIEDIDISEIEYDRALILKEFLSNTIEDLSDWANRVLVYKNVSDVHYIDMSINANILQLDLVLDL